MLKSAHEVTNPGNDAGGGDPPAGRARRALHARRNTDWINTPKAIERSPIAIVDGTVVAMGKAHYYEDFLKSRGRFKGTAERQG
jgi:hypothetical protein